MKNMKLIIRIFTIGLGVIIIGLLIWHKLGNPNKHHPQQVIAAEGFGWVQDFSLINQEGQTFGLKELKGNYWLTNFIFTRCAGPCPIISSKMAGLQKEYGKFEGLKFVSFSVDPEYDQPSVLKKYAERYGALKDRWFFLTGKRDEVYNLIRGSFHLPTDEPNDDHDTNDMEILHSLHFVLVDPRAEIKGYFNSNDPEAMGDLKLQLNSLLNQKTS